jgi:hypothetical protein
MTEIKLSKISKLIAAIVYIGLLVFLVWPFHMGNPLNWPKAILIIGVCACNAILQGKSALNGEFISTDIDRNYLLHYLVSCLMTVGIVVGSEDASFVGLVYLISGVCVGLLFFIVDIVAIISIIARNIGSWIDEPDNMIHIALKLPFANILFEQPDNDVNKDEQNKKVKM